MQRPQLQFAALAVVCKRCVVTNRCSGPSYLEMVAVGPSDQLVQHGKLHSSSKASSLPFVATHW